jgi:hypothetical protein
MFNVGFSKRIYKNIFCHQCGVRLSDKARFCSICGVQLINDEDVTIESISVISSHETHFEQDQIPKN